MKPFSYVEAATAADAIRTVVSTPGAVFFAGGTTLVDLMKLDVMAPDTLVDVYPAAARHGRGGCGRRTHRRQRAQQ